MNSPIRMRSWARSPRLGCDGAGASLHVRASVAFICANGTITSGHRGLTAAWCMRECRGAFELAEDGFLMGEKVAHKSIGMLFVEG